MSVEQRFPCGTSGEAAPVREHFLELGDSSSKLFDRVLVPIEFDTESKPLTSLAAGLAARFHCHILLVNVVQHEPLLARDPSVLALRQLQLDSIASTLRRAGAKGTETFLREGSTAYHVEQIGREHHASLILLLERAEQPAGHAWFGTLTQRLARRTITPLMVVKSESAAVFKPILCVVDFSDASRVAIGHAIATARESSATITFLHVVPEPLPFPLVEGPIWQGNTDVPRNRAEDGVRRPKSGGSDKGRLGAARKDVEKLLAGYDMAGVKTEIAVLSGSPVVEILTAARDRKSGVIYVGFDQRSGFVHVMSQSTAETLAETAVVPVLIFREPQGGLAAHSGFVTGSSVLPVN